MGYKYTFAPRSKFERWIRKRGGCRVVAKQLGVATSTVQHWVRGHVRPRLDTIELILKLAGPHLTSRDIIEGTRKK